MENQEPVKRQLPSAFSLFSPSFRAVLLNAWTFFGLLTLPMLYFVAVFVLGMGLRNTGGETTINIALLTLGMFGFLGTLVVSPSLVHVQLMGAKEKEVSVAEAFKAGFKYFWRFYGLSILVGLAVLGGILLLIVPGLIMMRRYYLATFYLFDRNVGVLEAMRLSAAESKPYSGSIWGIIGVSFLLGLPSVIPVFVIVSAALYVSYFCAPAIRYLQIKAAVSGSAVPTEHTDDGVAV